MTPSFAAIPEALEALRAGRMVLVSGDGVADRDVVVAAELATAEHVNFMATNARGLVSVALTPAAIERLRLPAMPVRRETPRGSSFMVTVEAASGVSTGISAADRAMTVRVAADPRSIPSDLVQPGHVQAVRAHADGVLQRPGRGEAAVDLTRLAGLEPAAAMCQVLGDDGRVASPSDLLAFGRRHDMPVVTIAALLEHRCRQSVQRLRWPRAHPLPTAAA